MKTSADEAVSAGPKTTSWEYGRDYQLEQARKYRERADNHWVRRLELAERLVAEHVAPRLAGREGSAVVVVDVGCSIGTFAIEFAKRGYTSYGIDFDPVALEIARDLAAEEGAEPVFVCSDVADWPDAFPPIDIAVCFDIFEHLHDDELGALLQAVRRHMSPEGALVFHTFPSEYEHVFFARDWVRWPMRPFALLPPAGFARVVKAYAAVIDAALAIFTGRTYKERLRTASHCNPLSAQRLADILERAGYELLETGTGQLHPHKSRIHRAYARHAVVDRNIWGVAVPRTGASRG